MVVREYGEEWARVVRDLAITGKGPKDVDRTIANNFKALCWKVQHTELNLNELQRVLCVTRGAPNATYIIMAILKTVGVVSLTGTSLQAAALYGHSKEVLETLASKLTPAKLKCVPMGIVSDAVLNHGVGEDIAESKALVNLMDVPGMILTGGAWRSVCMLPERRYKHWMSIFDELVLKGKMTPSKKGNRVEFRDKDIAKLVVKMGSVEAYNARIKDLLERGIAKIPEYEQLRNALAVMKDWRMFHRGDPAYPALVTAYARCVAKCRMSHHKPPLGPAKPLPSLTVTPAPPKRELANTASSAKRSRGSAAVASALQMGEKQSKKARAGPSTCHA